MIVIIIINGTKLKGATGIQRRRHWSCRWETGRRRGSCGCERPSFADGGSRTSPSSWLAAVDAVAAGRASTVDGEALTGWENRSRCRYRCNCCCCCSYCAAVKALQMNQLLLHPLHRLLFSERDGAIWLERSGTRPLNKSKFPRYISFSSFFLSSNLICTVRRQVINNKHFVCQNNQSRCYPEADAPTPCPLLYL